MIRLAIFGTVFIGALSFCMSFTSLCELAAANGVHQAWMLPLVLDGGVIVATAATVALERQRWFATGLLVASSVLSVAGNVAHAAHNPVAQVIAAVPALWLLAATHLTVMLVRQREYANRRPEGYEAYTDTVIGQRLVPSDAIGEPNHHLVPV